MTVLSIEFSIEVFSRAEYDDAMDCPGVLWGLFDGRAEMGQVYFGTAEQAEHAATLVASL